MKLKTVIVDYDAGNLKSIGNMLNYLGEDFLISSKEQDIKDAARIIFPGQGHFLQAMQNLDNKNLIEPIKTSIANGKPFWGYASGCRFFLKKVRKHHLLKV